jgi:hypothetical protein
MKKFLTPAREAILKSYLRAIAGATVTTTLAMATNMAPQYAVLIGAIAAPLIKWADSAEKQYGKGSKK